MFLVARLTITLVTAKHFHRKRFDLDHNGIPDFCYVDTDGEAHCLQTDRSWTSFATSTYVSAHPSSAPTLTSALVSTTASVTTSATSTSSATPTSTGTLPEPATFQKDNGTKWNIEHVGDIGYTDTLGQKGLGGDKCRSSVLGDKVIWNCGDMECAGDWQVCGFSMGPAFYGTDSVMTINTTGATNVNDRLFATAWSDDPTPVAPQTGWGMDTTNIAALNSTTGVAYAWEIWRGAPDNSIVNRGNAIVAVTLGETGPIATRTGPLLTGPDAIQLGLITILSDGGYVYSYSVGGPSGVIIGRVSTANDAAFDASQYEFLEYSTSNSTTWSKPSTNIPADTTTTYGAATVQSGGFGCSVYGSIIYSAYLNKYILFCSAYMWFMNFYTSDTPYGPWSGQYQLLNDWEGYGLMAHPEYSSADGKDLYISFGPNGPFYMFKVTFDY